MLAAQELSISAAKTGITIVRMPRFNSERVLMLSSPFSVLVQHNSVQSTRKLFHHIREWTHRFLISLYMRDDRALRAQCCTGRQRANTREAWMSFFAFILNLFSQCYVGATHKIHPRRSVAKVMALIPQPIKRPKESKKNLTEDCDL